MQLERSRLRSRFLRKARSESRAYPTADLQATKDEALRKKIKQTRPFQLHGHGSRRNTERIPVPHKAFAGLPGFGKPPELEPLASKVPSGGWSDPRRR